MNATDVLIIAVALAGFVKGMVCGFFRQVVSIVGFLVGLFVAFMLYSALGDWIAPHIGSGVTAGRALAFILLWIGVPVGLSLVAFLLTKAVESAHLGWLNRTGGALLGGLKYMVFLSCVLNVAWGLRLVSPAMEESRLYRPVCALSGKLFDMCKARVTHAGDGKTSCLQDEGAADGPGQDRTPRGRERDG